MRNKALKKRLSLQVLLNLEEVFNQESPLAAKHMRKRLKSVAKSLVKEFMKRNRSLVVKAKKKPAKPVKDPVVKKKQAVIKKKAAVRISAKK